MDLTTISRGDFLCSGNVTYQDVPKSFLDTVGSPFEDSIGLLICQLDEGFAIHEIKGSDGDVLLIKDWGIVGQYCAESLSIVEDYQGRDLAIPMILAAVKGRHQFPTSRKLTRGGEISLGKSWDVANGHLTNPWPCI